MGTVWRALEVHYVVFFVARYMRKMMLGMPAQQYLAASCPASRNQRSIGPWEGETGCVIG